MKRRFGLFLMVLIGFAVIAGSAVQEEQKSREAQHKKALDALKDTIQNSRPMGVSGENWIPLSANAGIVLKPATRVGSPSRSAYTGTILGWSRI